MNLEINSLEDALEKSKHFPARHLTVYLTIPIGSLVVDKEYLKKTQWIDSFKDSERNENIIKHDVQEKVYDIEVLDFQVPQHSVTNVYYITTNWEFVSNSPFKEELCRYITKPYPNHKQLYSYIFDIKTLESFLLNNDKNIKYITYNYYNFVMTLWEPIIMPE